jgi:hypothetical protein
LGLPGFATVRYISTSYTMAEKSDVSPESGMTKSGMAGHDAHAAVHTGDSTAKDGLEMPVTQSQMSLPIYLQLKVCVP